MRYLLFLASATIATATYVPGKAFDRFITIWLENQDFSKVDKNSNIKDLTKEGILLTSYFGLTHPSQPNYIASVGGDYFGLDHDGLVEIPQNISTLVDLLETRNIDWRGYFQGMIGPGYMGEGSTAVDGSGWDYVRKHNPFVSFQSINHNGSRLAKLQSFRAFEQAVRSNTLPQYMHMSPDMLNDGHNTSLEYAANWTQSFLGPLLENKEFMERTLILLTYDESETYEIPNRIVSLLLGDAIPRHLKGTKDDTFYTHYSIISTLENNWELPNLGRYDVGANVFDVVAKQTSHSNHPPSNIQSVNNSLSYGGFLNHDPKKYKPIPPPNLQLMGAGGKGVVEIVKSEWGSAAKLDTPYNGNGTVYDGGNGILNLNAPVYNAQAPSADLTNQKSAAASSRGVDINWAGFGLGLFAIAVYVL